MNNKDVAKKVVDRIINLIESEGSLPWVKPWNKGTSLVKIVDGYKEVTIFPSSWNRKGVPYKGVNTYLPDGEYITFNQCKAEGGSVKPGAKGFPVVYWNFYDKEITNDNGEKETVTIPVLKYYTVFNVSDCIGIKQKFAPGPRTIKIPCVHYESVDGKNSDLNNAAEMVIADYISRAGNGFHVDRDKVTNKACYYPGADYVSVPRREQFADVAEFYSTLFHELGHSTGHKSRLNRFTGAAACASFGSQEYSKEELVAESTAASILNALGMENANSFRNSAAYIKSWSEHIKNDPLMFVSAMTKAQAAFDLIIGIDFTAPVNPGDGDKPEEEKPADIEKPKDNPVVNFEKPVKSSAAEKKQAAAAKRLMSDKSYCGNMNCGWYKLDTPEDEPAQMIVTPYAVVTFSKLELPAEFDRADQFDWKEKRSKFFKAFDMYRADADKTMGVYDHSKVKALDELIKEDKKNRPLHDRKNSPLRYDFGVNKPMVNAVWLNEIISIIGSDNLTIRYAGELKPIYLNNNGNEAILFPIRKK